MGNKKNKMWLIYAYHRATGEIAAYVWGKRDYQTATKLRDKLRSMGIGYDTIYTDQWGCCQERKHQRDRRKQLPLEASDQTGIQKNMLFLFQSF